MEKEHDQTECLEFEIKIVWRGHHHLGLCWKFSSFCRKCMFKNRIKNNWLFPCCLKFLPHVLLLITIHYLPLTIVTCFFTLPRLPALKPDMIRLCILLMPAPSLAITYSQRLFSFLLLYSETFSDSPLSLKAVLRFFLVTCAYW